MRIEIKNTTVVVINAEGQVERSEFFETYADAYKAKCVAEAVWRALATYVGRTAHYSLPVPMKETE